jgi:hypothetical protein
MTPRLSFDHQFLIAAAWLSDYINCYRCWCINDHVFMPVESAQPCGVSFNRRMSIVRFRFDFPYHYRDNQETINQSDAFNLFYFILQILPFNTNYYTKLVTQ